MRRLAQVSVSCLTATLALCAAGWAVTGRVPLVAEPATPVAITAQATGPLVANDREGGAILTAGAMAPGAVAGGEVTIGNGGDARGAFTLSSGGAADSASPGGGLSGVLDLRVLELGTEPPTTLYAGTLRAFQRVALGSIAAGAERRYRFELRFPHGDAPAAHNVHQGASTAVAFTWDAVAVSPPEPDGVPDRPAPTPAPALPGASAPVPAPAEGAATGAAPASPSLPAPTVTPVPAPSTAVPGLGSAREPLDLGVARTPVVRGRLMTTVTGPAGARVRVTGVVTVGGRRLPLRAVSVALGARPRTVPVALPRQARRAGAPRHLTVRLVVTVTAGASRTTVRRTLRVTTR
jgi:hypothetical protein